MKLRNLILILVLLGVASLLLLYAISTRGANGTVPEQNSSVPTELNELENSASSSASVYSDAVIAAAKKYLEDSPAESYLLVRTNQGMYTPIPLNEENAFKITQADGSENTVHIGKNSFYMESSNCDNQNCVQEGEVTLENMNTRVLFNMVICLPHQLTLEMLTPEQAETVLLEMYTQQESNKAAMDAWRNDFPENQESSSDAGADS